MIIVDGSPSMTAMQGNGMTVECMKYLRRCCNGEAGDTASNQFTSACTDQWNNGDSTCGVSKFVWVRDVEHAFVIGRFIGENGSGLCTVRMENGSTRTVDKLECQSVNPVIFSKAEDMAKLACLNEACILFNLKERYECGLIYTYSGLFCVVINPYRLIPIYGEDVMAAYKNRAVRPMPPHIFAIADKAYVNMLESHEDQSILCTGESGAGKTENTKKVVQYLAYIASGPDITATGQQIRGSLRKHIKPMVDHQCLIPPSTSNVTSLKCRLLQANPILESFGNAKTIKNDNSSRFGKFIRISFGDAGQIIGGSIETYLLEKSRTIRQSKGERAFHIFYQLFKGADRKILADECLLTSDPSRYKYLVNGDIGLSDVDDCTQFDDTVEALNVMGISTEEQMNLFKILSAILHMGNLEFVQPPDTDEPILTNEPVIGCVAALLGVDPDVLLQGFLRPRMRAGRDNVHRFQSVGQIVFAVEAISKALYERLFDWIVERINITLSNTTKRPRSFIGILDIAGFEIFTVNSFEQLCINYTNEKLQQLFNHTMFVQEQNEYRSENIEWTFTDFGKDLQPTIDLIERPMGILSLLDDECWLPKTSDVSFVDKLIKTHSSHPKFARPSVKCLRQNFGVVHYAGKVEYQADKWLMKNMDPLNANVVEICQHSVNLLVRQIWRNIDPISMSTLEMLNDTIVCPTARHSSRKGVFRTVGQTYKEQLGKLMKVLQSTTPNFIRCIIPNHRKLPRLFDSTLILDQLQCNGVLEGIRVCRYGYPNRVELTEFHRRYEILCSKVAAEKNLGYDKLKDMCKRMIDDLELDEKLYLIGKTKIFFRAGVVGYLEEEREYRISEILCQIQSLCRGVLARNRYRSKIDQIAAMKVIQKTGRIYLKIQSWPWWHLFTKLRPLLHFCRLDDQIKLKSEELEEIERETTEMMAKVTSLNELRETMWSVNKELSDKVREASGANKQLREERNALQLKLAELDGTVQDLDVQYEEKRVHNSIWRAEKDRHEKQMEELTRNLDDDRKSIQTLDGAVRDLDNRKRAVERELMESADTIKRLNFENSSMKERLDNLNSQQLEDHQQMKRLDADINEGQIKIKSIEEQISQTLQTRQKIELVVVELETEKNCSKERLGEIESEKQALRSKLHRKVEELNRLQVKLTNNSNNSSIHTQIIRDLKMKIGEAQQGIEAEKATRCHIENDKKTLAEENESLQNEISSHTDGNLIIEGELRMRDNDIANVRQNIKRIVHERDLEIREARERYNREVDHLSDQLDSTKRISSTMHNENRILQDQVAGLEDELAQLKVDILDWTLNYDKCNERYENVLQQTVDAEQKRAEVNEQLKAVLANMDSKYLTTIESNTRLQSMERSEALLKQEMQDTYRSVEAEKYQNECLRNECLRVEERLSALDAMISNKEDELQACNQANFNLKARFVKAEQEYQDDQKKVLTEANASVQKERESLMAQLEHWKATAERSEFSMKKLQNELSDCVVELQNFEMACKKLEKQRSTAEKRIEDELAHQQTKLMEKVAAETELQQMDDRITELTSRLSDIEYSIELKNSQVDQLSAELDETLCGKDSIGQNLHELGRKKRNLEMEIKEQLQKISDLEEEVYEADSARIQSESDVDELKLKANCQLDEALNSNDERMRSIMDQMRELEAELDENRKVKIEATASCKQIENEMFNTEVDFSHVVDERGSLSRHIRKINLSCKCLKIDIDDIIQTKETSLSNNAKLSKQIDQLEDDLQHLQRENELAEKTRRNLLVESNDLREVLIELESNKNVPVGEKNQLDRHISELEDELDLEVGRYRGNDEKLHKITLQLNQLRTEQSKKTAHFKSVKSNLTRQQQELKSKLAAAEERGSTNNEPLSSNLSSRAKNLEEQIDSEQAEKHRLERSIRHVERKFREVTAQCESGSGSLEMIREQLRKVNARIQSTSSLISNNHERMVIVRDDIQRAEQEKMDAHRSLETREQRIKQIQSRMRGNSWSSIKRSMHHLETDFSDTSSQRSQRITTSTFREQLQNNNNNNNNNNNKTMHSVATLTPLSSSSSSSPPPVQESGRNDAPNDNSEHNQ